MMLELLVPNDLTVTGSAELWVLLQASLAI